MDELLELKGSAKKVYITRAEIKKGTFSEKEGKKEFLIEANYNQDNSINLVKTESSIENWIYLDGNILCKHISDKNAEPIAKYDFFWDDGYLVRKTKVDKANIIQEDDTFYYDSKGKLCQRKSKTLTYEYSYNGENLVEERWHSEFTLNQIIRYSYDINNKLTEIAHFSGDEIPGRKTVYTRESHGFITDEIIYSPGGTEISHIKYSYPTIYKDNWLKRIKYKLTQPNKIKESVEAIYREIEFYPSLEEPIIKESIQEPISINISESEEESLPVNELIFDNGTYKGDILEGQMHGLGEFIFNTGTIYIGEFKNNSMEGRGSLTYKSGKVYEGTFKKNLLQGPGACKWENGDFYAGEFNNGKMHGRGCYIWANGNRFEGIFENNKRTEQGILYKASELESTAPPKWVEELFKIESN